ncbi:MAG: hypothetical protein ACRD9R_15820 [Pyrinomonadaceae bacterium]
MSEKRSKYDTDPLDPDFARRTEEILGEETRALPTTGETGATTGDAHRRGGGEGEAPTRLMDETLSQPYRSMFNTPPQPQTNQPSPQTTYHVPPPTHPMPQPPGGIAYGPHPTTTAPTPHQYAQPYLPERRIAGINIPEKWATTAPYAPFYIGLVASLIELLTVPRREVRARFHAAQGLALQLSILAINFAFTVIGYFGNTGLAQTFFALAAFIFLIYSMVRVWKGEPHRLAPLEEGTHWLDERIEPRNK